MSPTEAKDYGIIDAVYSANGSPLTGKDRLDDAPDKGETRQTRARAKVPRLPVSSVNEAQARRMGPGA